MTEHRPAHYAINRSTYIAGCRCEGCTAANTEYQAKATYARGTRSADGHPEGKPISISTYTNWMCRCDGCSALALANMRRRYQDRKARA